MYRLKIWLAISAAFTAAAFGAFGDVVSSFEMPPITDRCYGLAWDGEYLWSCGSPTVHFVRLTTEGSVVTSFRVTGGEYGLCEGATWDGAYLWSTWAVVSYDVSFTRYTTTGSRVGRFRSDPGGGGSAGLAWENDGLWCEGTKYNTVGSIIASFRVPFSLGDLAWDGHYLWSGNKQLTTTGSFVQSFAPPAVGTPSGTTFDGNYLWINMGRWTYQVDIDVVGINPGSFGKIKSLYR
jgi:hypothetical protein